MPNVNEVGKIIQILPGFNFGPAEFLLSSPSGLQ